MKTFGITKPCSENWETMTPNEKGAFCAKCAKNVFDWSGISRNEILNKMKEFAGQSLCAKMDNDQHDYFKEIFDSINYSEKTRMNYATVLSLFMVFGIGLFSFANHEDLSTIKKAHQNFIEIVNTESPNDPEDSTLIQRRIAPRQLDIDQVIDLDEITVRGSRRAYTEQYYNSHIVGAMYIPHHHEIEELPTPEIQKLDENGNPLPKLFDALVYPNPTKGNVSLKIDLPEDQQLSFQLFDLSGREIQSFKTSDFVAGTRTQRLSLSVQTRGIYILNVVGKEYQKAIRVLIEP